MTNDRSPLGPDEDAYRTEQDTAEVARDSGSAAAGSSIWLIIGLILLAVFVVALISAVVLPALT